MRKNNSRIFRCRQGFTMIELLITASLVAVLSVAVFSVLMRGMDVWKRVRSMDRAEDDVRLDLDKFSRELRTSFDFTPIVFTGEKGQIMFSTYLRAFDGEGLPMEALGKVTYFYSPEEKTLFRRQENYSDLFHPKRATFEKFIAPVEEAVFTYYAFNPAKQKFEWKEKWNEPSRPAGVRLTLAIPDHENKKNKHIDKTVYFQ
ncbi:MAG: prepilin-type N-terminal cleavage/methylation domain-containing protein [Candidatus Omnitrophota bacterium]